MSAWEAIAMFVAGLWAGTINTVVGSGTLVTFPVLLSFGYAPVIANVSNTVGLVPGFFTGAFGLRDLLEGQRARVVPLAIASTLGGLVGALLLLWLPAKTFQDIVPAFVAVAVILIVFQPRIARMLAARRPARVGRAGPIATVIVFAAGIYGGYFGAAQGVLVLAVLGLGLNDTLQRLNAVKVVTTGLVNLVSALVFIIAAHVAWGPAGLIAGGSVLGGVLGARIGRRLPAHVLRATIVVVGTIAILRLLA